MVIFTLTFFSQLPLSDIRKPLLSKPLSSIVSFFLCLIRVSFLRVGEELLTGARATHQRLYHWWKWNILLIAKSPSGKGGASETPPLSTMKHWLARSWVGLVQITSPAESLWVQRPSCPKDISPASSSYMVSFSSPVISPESRRDTLTHLMLSTSLLLIVSTQASYGVYINCLSLSKAGCSNNIWV